MTRTSDVTLTSSIAYPAMALTRYGWCSSLMLQGAHVNIEHRLWDIGWKYAAVRFFRPCLWQAWNTIQMMWSDKTPHFQGRSFVVEEEVRLSVGTAAHGVSARQVSGSLSEPWEAHTHPAQPTYWGLLGPDGGAIISAFTEFPVGVQPASWRPKLTQFLTLSLKFSRFGDVLEVWWGDILFSEFCLLHLQKGIPPPTYAHHTQF